MNTREHLNRFDVWAPHARTVTVRIEGDDHDMIPAADLPEDSPAGTVRCRPSSSMRTYCAPVIWWTPRARRAARWTQPVVLPRPAPILVALRWIRWTARAGASGRAGASPPRPENSGSTPH